MFLTFGVVWLRFTPPERGVPIDLRISSRLKLGACGSRLTEDGVEGFPSAAAVLKASISALSN
jgi:hypothetical protein